MASQDYSLQFKGEQSFSYPKVSANQMSDQRKPRSRTGACLRSRRYCVDCTVYNSVAYAILVYPPLLYTCATLYILTTTRATSISPTHAKPNSHTHTHTHKQTPIYPIHQLTLATTNTPPPQSPRSPPPPLPTTSQPTRKTAQAPPTQPVRRRRRQCSARARLARSRM